MRVQTIIGVLLGGLATATLAQVATAPVETKGATNAQTSDEAPPASNGAAPANDMAPAASAAPKDEALPSEPANGVAPIEPKG